MNEQEQLIIRKDELIEEPAAARIAVGLCLDASYSMDGDPIRELNEGVSLFFDAIRSDEIASSAAEIGVVTFGDIAKKLLDFHPIHKQQVPVLTASGCTPMGAAVNMILDMLDQTKQAYRAAGVDYYQPWLVIKSDGQPTDDIEEAARRTVDLVQNKKLTVFPIGIGANADMNVLKRFSPTRDPLKLQGLNFRAFFEWLSKSVSAVSRSIPGQAVPLNQQGITGWAQI